MASSIAFTTGRAFALSEELHSPAIFFPKGYDTNRAERILAILRSTNQFEFRGGMTSYWEPKFQTTLIYDGSSSQLKSFVAALDAIEGVRVHLVYADDLKTAKILPTGSWSVEYSHTMPNTVVVTAMNSLKNDASDSGQNTGAR